MIKYIGKKNKAKLIIKIKLESGFLITLDHNYGDGPGKLHKISADSNFVADKFWQKNGKHKL